MSSSRDVKEGSTGFCENSAVEIDGAVLFGVGYEGGWHAAKIIAASASEEGEIYEVELKERSPVNQMPQIARSVPGDYVRPQRPTERLLQHSYLKPGMVVEHMLPETPTCWWLAFIVETGDNPGATIVGYPGKKGQTETANQSHKFRVARHWDLHARQWVSPLLSGYAGNALHYVAQPWTEGPLECFASSCGSVAIPRISQLLAHEFHFADVKTFVPNNSSSVGFQPSMEANYAEIAKRRKSKGLSVAVPVITDPLEEHAAKGRSIDAQPLKSTAAGGSRPEAAEQPPAVQGGAKTVHSAVDAADTGANKRRRTSAGNGARTKGALTSKVRNTAGTVPHVKSPAVEDRNALNAAPEAPAAQPRPNASGKRKSTAATVPTYRQLSLTDGKKAAQPAENNHNGSDEVPPGIKPEAQVHQRKAVAGGAGQAGGVGASPSALVPAQGNADADCIDMEAASKQDEVLRALEIREREQAVRQKEVETVQAEIGVMLSLISSDAIPASERTQLRSSSSA